MVVNSNYNITTGHLSKKILLPDKKHLCLFSREISGRQL